MSDFAAFAAACASTPALLTSACALLFVPTLAWLVVRSLTPALVRMTDDPAWQAPLTAVAASVPGILFFVIGAATIRLGWESPCLQFTTGRVLYAAIVALAAFGFVRATTLALRRACDVARLLGRSSVPSARVRDAAAVVGTRIREIPDAGAVVLLVGLFRPVVLVSTAALQRVNDAELRAAIRHEAAHALRGDLICAAVVTFIADVVPLPVGRLIALHRRAREFAADAHAARVVDPCDLASALLALARPANRSISTAAFAESGTVRDRLGVLLSPTSLQPSRSRRMFMTATLAATFVMGAAPVLVAVILGFTCSMVTPA